MNDELIRAQLNREYASKLGSAAQNAIIGGLDRSASPPADFHNLLGRIRQATMEASEARAHAGAIADTMHGHLAEQEGAACAKTSRSGLIGQYEDAIDELMSVLSDTRSNLRRISNGIPDGSKSILGSTLG